jgi:hypothetical protein
MFNQLLKGVMEAGDTVRSNVLNGAASSNPIEQMVGKVLTTKYQLHQSNSKILLKRFGL